MIQIYKASAGSGKTFTLAREYIKMMLGRQLDNGEFRLDTRGRNRHRPILAITFTNKATGEMKRRIIDELAVLGQTHPADKDKKSPYIADLCRDLHCNPDKLAAEARRGLAELLFDYDYFCISTIDSFFQQVLRTFAREAELNGNYELSLDDKLAVRQAVDELFLSLGNNSRRDISPSHRRRLESWLTRYLTDLLMRGKSIKLFNRSSSAFNELCKFTNTLMNEVYYMHEQELRLYFEDSERIGRLSQALAALLDTKREMARQLCGSLLCELDGRKAVAAGFVRIIREFVENGNLPKPEAKTLPNVIANPDKAFTSTPKDAARANLADGNLRQLIVSATNAMQSLMGEELTFGLLGENLYALGLFADIVANMEADRRETATLLLKDTGTLLRDILKDAGDSPFVFERMGNRLSHFLIDEFQDTSRLQWQNLQPLITETLSRGCESLIIGDEKQCIYRFRNSDPTLLKTEVQTRFAGAVTVKGDNPGDNTNWRSSRNVINFNNKLFENLAAQIGVGDIYSNVCQQVSPRNADESVPGGYVDLMIGNDCYPDESYLGAAATKRCNGLEGSALAVQMSLERLGVELSRQFAAGRRAGDIAILVRKKDEGARVISYLLERQRDTPDFPHFRIVSDDSLALGSSPSVRLIVSLLRRLVDPSLIVPDDKDSVGARIIRLTGLFHTYISQGFDRNEALRLSLVDLESRPQAEDSDTGMLLEATRSGCPNLLSTVENLIRIYLGDETRDRENLYISTFVDCVADYANRLTEDGADIGGFLRWWDSVCDTLTVTVPGDSDTMTVMTIHKSKGLEFPCVHIPFAAMQMVFGRFDSNQRWFDTAPLKQQIPPAVAELIPPLYPLKPVKKLENTVFGDEYRAVIAEQWLDTLNVFYVALTRAVEELSVTMFTGGKTAPDDNICGLTVKALSQMGYADTDADGLIHFISGEPVASKAAGTSANNANGNLMPSYTSGAGVLWADVRIEMPDAAIDLHPASTDVSDSEDYVDETARRRGIVLHKALSMINTADDLPRALRRLVRGRSIRESDVGDIHDMLLKAINNPRVSPWFAPGLRVLNERGIRTSTDHSAQSMLKRPDRVVFMPDGSVMVVDYKFGFPTAKSIAHYRSQVRDYVRRLTATGLTDVHGSIWLIDEQRVIDV